MCPHTPKTFFYEKLCILSSVLLPSLLFGLSKSVDFELADLVMFICELFLVTCGRNWNVRGGREGVVGGYPHSSVKGNWGGGKIWGNIPNFGSFCSLESPVALCILQPVISAMCQFVQGGCSFILVFHYPLECFEVI